MSGEETYDREEPRGDQEGLEPDPLAEKLAPGGAVELVGILGQGPTEDDWHLYLNRELTRRAEFKASDVLHSEKIREEDPPFHGTQGTRVYLRRGARVVYTSTQSLEIQAEFLRGDLGARLTAEAGPERLLGAEAPQSRLMCTPRFAGTDYWLCQISFWEPTCYWITCEQMAREAVSLFHCHTRGCEQMAREAISLFTHCPAADPQPSFGGAICESAALGFCRPPM